MSGPAGSNRGTTVRHGTIVRLPRTLEREIEEIMAQVAPRREVDETGRGVVSVLFVSINGYVALCEGIEPPAVGAILDVYVQTVADSVGRFLGTVQSTMSDTIMATWNAVYPQADHAVLAVNSALDMVERIDDINLRLEAGGLPGISYGVGVNTGDVLVRRAGRLHRDNDVIGDTVNVAYLLSLMAPRSGILIGEGTYVSTGGQILVEECPPARLPGKSRPVRTFRVLGRPAAL